MTNGPERIGRYEIGRVLGRGSMGVIYKAHDPEIDRPVAIKLVRCDLLQGQERADYLVRFRREAQLAARCVHPNIVAVYDYAMHEGNPFLAMEYVEGMSFALAMGSGPRFSAPEAIFIVAQILDALACMHGLGVIHRDVKPANVLLLGNGRVKVTDFGISRIGGSDLTLAGLVVGTPSYMSPEQCRGEEVGHRSDLFSAGVVLFEMLTGERPFPGTSLTGIMSQLLSDEAAPDLKGRVPEPLAAVVRRALAKNPADRFPSAEAQMRALRGALSATGQEATVVLPSRSPAPAVSSGTADFGVEALAALERRLARHVGPIARVLVGNAARQAESFDELCQLLARSIDQQPNGRASCEMRGTRPRRSPRDCTRNVNLQPTQCPACSGAPRRGHRGHSKPPLVRFPTPWFNSPKPNWPARSGRSRGFLSSGPCSHPPRLRSFGIILPSISTTRRTGLPFSGCGPEND